MGAGNQARRLSTTSAPVRPDVFAEVVGVELDDFLALAWFFWNAARNEGQVGFNAT